MGEMKDSGVEWMGEIPRDWNTVSTKFLFNIFSGATPDSSNPEYWEGGIRWITPADYKSSDVYIDGGRRNLSQKGFASCSTSMIPAGSLIFSKRAPIGSVAINRFELCTNQGCLACVCKGKEVVKYYYYVMAAAAEQYELLGSGTTCKEISLLSFANFKLPFPDNQVQHTISSYLDKKCAQVDALITNVQAQIEKLKAYKQSVITEAVTKGLDPSVPMKDSGVEWMGAIPASWSLVQLKNAASLKTGHTPPTTDTDNFGGGINWYTPGDFTADVVSASTRTLTSYAIEKEGISLFPKHATLLIGIGGTSGKVCKIAAPGYSNQQITAIIAKNHVNSDFLFYEMMAARQYLRDNAMYTTFPIINNGYLGSLRFALPSMEEQAHIVRFLNEKCALIDRLIAVKDAKIEKLGQYKKSLIYEYVTGKKEPS